MQVHPTFRHKGLINLFVVVLGECVVGLGKWKMGKGLRCGYFFKKIMCELQKALLCEHLESNSVLWVRF